MKAQLIALLALAYAALPQAAETKLGDAEIAHIAYTAGKLDIEAAKQAIDRSADPGVKAFAETMVRDHEAVNEQALALVAKLGVTPVDNPVSKSLAEGAAIALASHESLQGAAFDREYINAMVQGHQEVLGKVRARVEAKVPAPGAAAGEHPAGEHPAGEHPAGAGSRDRDTAKTKSPAQNPGAGDTAGHGQSEAQLTQWAAKVMPTVQMHLDRARELQQKVAK